jgi:hypothetical protein
MSKTVCKIMGFLFLIIGIVGFVQPNILGFHLSGIHSIIHLATAALAFYFGFGASVNAAKTFVIVFGLVYMGLGILGFAMPDLVANILQAHQVHGVSRNLTPDNIFHITAGAILVVSALVQAPASAILSK